MNDQRPARRRISPEERRWRVERWELEVDLLQSRYERDVEAWRHQRTRLRRGWRVLEALTDARSSIRAFLALPVKLIRILASEPELPQKPTEPDFPPHPFADEPSPIPHIEAGRVAFEAGDHKRSLAQAQAALVIDPEDVRALDLAWRSLESLGEVTRAIELVRAQRSVLDRTRLRMAERRLSGWLVATDPRWVPMVPGVPRDPSGPPLVIGDLEDVATLPSNVTHVAGLPRRDFEDLEQSPMDVTITDLAALAARRTRGRPPAVILAPLRVGDIGPAVAALALSRAIGTKLRLVLRDPADHPPAGSEAARRLERRYAQLAEAANDVIENTADAERLLATNGGS